MENRYLKWLSGNTSSIYWHDSAVIEELDEAIGNGACGMTTNPFLIASTLNAHPDFWKNELQGVEDGVKGDERAEEWIAQTVGYLARKLKVFRKDGFGRGYCCAQTNPTQPGDTQAMIKTAKHYSAGTDNVVIKFPATRGGIEALEECAALGMNVAATVSFTVPQVLAVGEAVSRGQAKAKANGIKPGLAIAVLMVGRLDDYLRDVMNDTRAAATESDIIWAGTAAIKRAYSIFNERKYDCVLMPAGCRGGYHITQLAGANMIMSISPSIAKSLLDETRFEELIDADVDPAIIDRLMTMPEFRKAYEPDGMSVDEFITFGSCNRTLDQFVQLGWNLLKAVKL
ncbi:MAG: transaldolase family protein [Clostridia bacterium]|nr:transaldolase family protein [Clostridia bacterium]